MIKMATMPIYGKTLYKSLLQNQWTDGLGTWYVTSGTMYYQDRSNDDLELTLTFFYGKVKYRKDFMESFENFGLKW